jgi:hypothetical protein
LAEIVEVDSQLLIVIDPIMTAFTRPTDQTG